MLYGLALAGWMAVQNIKANVGFSSAGTSSFYGSLALVDVSQALAVDESEDGAESQSQRTDRLNRNLLIAAISILTFFVLFRLVLVWQISRNRKKNSQNNLLEGEA